MKLWILTTSLSLFLLILSGCGGTPKPSDKENAVLDKTLSAVVLTKNGTILGMKSVAFEWESITNPKVQGIYVYKKVPSASDSQAKEKLSYYATIQSRFSTHYVDMNVEPDTRYVYSFKTFSEIGEGAIEKEIVVNTLPILSSVSWIHSITGMPRVAKIIWRPHSNQRVKAYVMERKTLEDEKWEKIDTIQGRLNAEYIDEELQDDFVYMYRLRALTFDGIISTPSQIVKVVTKALPKGVTNLVATTSGANKIVLNWDESVQKDFALYYLYRSEDIYGTYELIAKLYNNKYIDEIEENGKIYFYRLSAVDTDSLESKNTNTTAKGKTLNRPLAPSIVEAKRIGNNIEIHWRKTDPRSISYNVTRSLKKGWFDETSKEFTDIKGNQFIDENVQADTTYTYVIKAVDIHGIKSIESIKVKIVTPEKIQNKQTATQVKEVLKEEETLKVKEETAVTRSENLDLSGL